jgi:hypothetical protein
MQPPPTKLGQPRDHPYAGRLVKVTLPSHWTRLVCHPNFSFRVDQILKASFSSHFRSREQDSICMAMKLRFLYLLCVTAFKNCKNRGLF